MAVRVIVVHGEKGSPDEGWCPWLRQMLEMREIEGIFPSLPTSEPFTLADWSSAFSAAVGTLGERDILIGHSLGAAFVLRVLEQSPIFFRAAVLVSPFSRAPEGMSGGASHSSFIAAPFRWSRIRKAARQVFVFAGDNDLEVPLPYSEDVAGALSVPTQVVPGGGHLDGPSGFREFPELLRLLEKVNDRLPTAR